MKLPEHLAQWIDRHESFLVRVAGVLLILCLFCLGYLAIADSRNACIGLLGVMAFIGVWFICLGGFMAFGFRKGTGSSLSFPTFQWSGIVVGGLIGGFVAVGAVSKLVAELGKGCPST